METKFSIGDKVFTMMGEHAVSATISGMNLATDGTTVEYSLKGLPDRHKRTGNLLFENMEDLKESLAPVDVETYLKSVSTHFGDAMEELIKMTKRHTKDGFGLGGIFPFPMR